MPDFRPATAAELKTLKALGILQEQVRRLDARLATKWARVRLARTLKAVRSTRTVSDLKWHAQVTAREAEALYAIARARKARPVFEAQLKSVRTRLD